MNNAQCRKAYVSVNVDVDEEGTIHPCFIRWKDGLIFQIDKVLYKCRATSKKVGGGGIRYTVLIRGKESFLFHEGDKWFVEAKIAEALRYASDCKNTRHTDSDSAAAFSP